MSVGKSAPPYEPETNVYANSGSTVDLPQNIEFPQDIDHTLAQL